MRYLIWLVAIPVALVVIAFAVANRDPAMVSFSPLPFVLDIPLWAVVVGAVLFGIIVGGTIRWLMDHRWRRLARVRGRRLRAVEKDAALLRDKLAKQDSARVFATGKRDARPIPPPEAAA